MFSRQIGRNAGRLLSQASRSTTTVNTTTVNTSRTYATGAARGTSQLRKVAFVTIYGFAFAFAGAFGTYQAIRLQGMGFTSDEASLRAFVPPDTEARRADETINAHPLVQELRRRGDLTESRPHMKMPAEYRSRSLTAGTLIGHRKVPVPPYAWSDDAGTELVSVTFVGEDLCGHPGLVHGGMLATMLDEGLARCCMKALPNKLCVTANLNIDYRKPTPAGSFLVLKARTTKVQGRKAWVKGHIELLAGPGETPVVVAEASGLFIEPKYAAMMPRIV
ncbi:hypothetical protein N3K66_006057 [Trichothecium roseum]|uniref:Uncharacterized protein n=1 Tax=Trichothecium roseum TaxID=47278 RepID=A0ACC0UZY8_9HYPO|nr:hypothetical protein N3K66_006057 [Trichothecium roseum]